MAVSSESDVAKKLAALQLTFKQQLSGKIDEIERLWASVGDSGSDAGVLSDVQRMTHSLAGSGGTFGAIVVSNVARTLEQAIKSLVSEQATALSKTLTLQIDELLIQLRQAADTWQPSAIPYIRAGEPKEQRDSDLIYLAEDDELLAADLITKLEQADYHVRHFARLSDFEAACLKEVPAAVIMDIVFDEGEVGGAEVITRLKDNMEVCPPVVFISVRDDIEVRLAAARAGARRYFSKPLNTRKLIQTLDGLTARMTAKPFRILLIDDDASLLEYYATVLSDA
ncbi:MAG: response regulator, partial [Gammaproteobacteria bacterium]|nr:response regulator [Gammaproteobacteria bacterium]